MGNTDERYIESHLIDILTNNGYELIDNSNISNEAKAWENIRKQLSHINKRDITDTEIEDIKREIKKRGDRTSYFAYEFNIMLNDGIITPNRNKGITNAGNKPCFQLIDKSCASNNKFQVTHQVVDNGNRSSRYDVTILLNGFPVVQIELKRFSVEINQAINQINNYIGNAFTGLFKYLQLFVVSNGESTRYGINNNSKLNKLFMFNWTDEKNNVQTPLAVFANTFLTRDNLFNILTKYIVRYNTGNGKMIVMRPYQIHAVEAVLKRITLPLDVKQSRANNGYIFHTTGSGKTITSWKCVQLASEKPEISKVVFLVDRKDLDAQTFAEFKSIESRLDVDNTENTKALLENFKSQNKFAITTIQKLSIAIKRACEASNFEYSSTFGKYINSRVVFIIDECHRSQFGEMRQIIDKFFKNAIYIGFTGTPIFNEDQTQSGLTTKALFGDQLHSYRIQDAIKDRNVLGFSVDYYNTAKEKEDANKKKELTDKNIDKGEVLLNSQRIVDIVNKIYEIHDRKTLNRKYTALFAVESIPMLLKYYNEFKRHNEELKVKGRDTEMLKVSAIFTVSGDDGVSDDSAKANYWSIVNDFNDMMKTHCKSDDSFRSELVKRLKCENNNSIDIVIVVGIFLTGFDSKMTNTLYVDKNLELHNLIQSFSRTNRVESELKTFGNIVCFRNLKTEVDEAIALYNYGKDLDKIITKDYRYILEQLFAVIDEVIAIVPEDNNMQDKTDTQKKDFIEKMRELNKLITEIKQQKDFNWEDITEKYKDKFNEERYAKLVGQMREIKADTLKPGADKESILNNIDFCMELVETDNIDTEYIKRLIKTIDLTNAETLKASIDNIKDMLNKSVDVNLRYKSDLIKAFLNKLILDYPQLTDKQKEDFDITGEFRRFVIEEESKDIQQKANEAGMSVDTLENEIVAYENIGKINKEIIKEQAKAADKLPIKKRVSFIDAICNFIETFPKKFNDLLS